MLGLAPPLQTLDQQAKSPEKVQKFMSACQWKLLRYGRSGCCMDGTEEPTCRLSLIRRHLASGYRGMNRFTNIPLWDGRTGAQRVPVICILSETMRFKASGVFSKDFIQLNFSNAKYSCTPSPKINKVFMEGSRRRALIAGGFVPSRNGCHPVIRCGKLAYASLHSRGVKLTSPERARCRLQT